tara:strand:+ start:1915 stop:2319 length:405 start_codon:yes stop_codon:yes gene_type:complete
MDFRKIILLVTIFSFMSVGWGQSEYCDNPIEFDSIDEICNLTDLTEIDLTKNNLTELPDCIGDLTNLTCLDLTSNNLTELPESIGNLINLEEFGFPWNQITTLPESIGNLISLRTVGFNENFPQYLGKVDQEGL